MNKHMYRLWEEGQLLKHRQVRRVAFVFLALLSLFNNAKASGQTVGLDKAVNQSIQVE